MTEADAEAAIGGERGEETAVGSDDLARLRAALLAAYPETVEELVVGQSVGELLDSVERAGAAYRRIADRVAPAPPDSVVAEAAPPVPAGDVRPLAVDPEGLPTVEKIRRGLAGRA